MGKNRSTAIYSTLGIAGGAAGLTTSAGSCVGGCSACLRCAAMGIILVAAALVIKYKGEKPHGMAQSNN